MFKTPYSLPLLFFLLPALLFSGCQRLQSAEEDPTLASLGGEQLHLSQALADIPPALLARDTIAAIRQYQENWIERQILLQEAERAGLQRNREFQYRLDRMRAELLVQMMQDALLERNMEQLEVSDEEARNYYQANRERFRLEERYVRFRHLTAANQGDAASARQQILNGVPWEEVARRYSLFPDRQIEQSERFTPVSMAFPDLPPMRDMLDIIGITEISPIRSFGGYYHFVQLMEERPEGDHPELDWLIDQIRDWLYLEKSRRFLNSYRRNLYLQAEANNEIEILDVETLNPASYTETEAN